MVDFFQEFPVQKKMTKGFYRQRNKTQLTSVTCFFIFRSTVEQSSSFLLTSHYILDTTEEVFFFSLFNLFWNNHLPACLIHLSMILLSTWDDCHETPPMTSSAASGGCCEKTCQDTWSLQRTKLHIVQWRLEESGYNDRLCHGSHSCKTKLSQNISYWNMLMFSALHKKAFCHEGLCLAHLFWLDNSTDRLVASVSWIYQLKSQWSACPFFAKIQWENKWLQHNEENLLFWSVLAICCQWLRLGWWLELLQENTLPRKCAL